MKNFLVTGGLGFLGSELVRILLNSGCENIHVIDDLSTGSLENQYCDVTYHKFNICDRNKLTSLFKEIRFECVFHFAALPRIMPSFVDPGTHNDVNISGTLILLEIYNQHSKSDCIFINSSSSSVYGVPQRVPSEETDRVSPLNPYALQKYTAETYVSLLCEYWGRKFTNLRYFNPYGPKSFNAKNPMNAYSSVIGIWLENIKKDLPLRIYGSGDQSRDFIHSIDVAKINIECYRLLKSGVKLPKILNVGTGKTYSLNKIISIIKKYKNISVIREDGRLGEAPVTHASIKLLSTYIHNHNFLNLESYIREQLDA